MGWKLKRLKQCEKCPWKKATDPRDIPRGYSEERHKALRNTIAEPGALPSGEDGKARHVMACHEHDAEEGVYCLGWLMHALGEGNDIEMRIRAMSCDNLDKVRLDGPQHESFEETLPKDDQATE